MDDREKAFRAQHPNILTEDQVKEAIRKALEAKGWQVRARMGHERGIDIEADKGAERWIIEAKGFGYRQQIGDYFLAVLGELLQRMDNDTTKYSIAFPEDKDFIGLWNGLPRLAKSRTQMTCLFVNLNGELREER
jgi:hypothetical protein